MRFRILFLCLVLIIVSSLGWHSSSAQTEQKRYFPETGHYVSGIFLQKYLEVKHPEIVYGWPITDAFVDQASAHTVQYFQRARFELHPEERPELSVKLTPLGQYLYESGKPVVLPANLQPCQNYPETGKRVCGVFLDFLRAYGGVAQFGHPITNFETQDGRFVQYFQMARFEWYPENPTSKQVVLTDLGMRYFEQQQEDPARLLPSLDSNTIQTVLELRVRAFAQDAVSRRNGEQTVVVLVRDQNQTPIENGRVEIQIELPSGEVLSSGDELLSDSNGLVSYTFVYNSRVVGPAHISVITRYGELEKRTVTSFRIWW